MVGDPAPPETVFALDGARWAFFLGDVDGIVEARPTGASCFGEAALRRYLTPRVDKRAWALIDDLAGLVSTLRPDDDIAPLALTADH